jgi:hypothetical protein
MSQYSRSRTFADKDDLAPYVTIPAEDMAQSIDSARFPAYNRYIEASVLSFIPVHG